MLKLFEDILKRIPILRTIYSAITQMTETFTKKDNNQKSVVLLEYPRKGIWAVGFATKENKGLIKDKLNEDLVKLQSDINKNIEYVLGPVKKEESQESVSERKINIEEGENINDW